MALSVSNGMTILSSEDGTASNWDEMTTSDYTEGMREGTGYVGYDVDIETLHNFDTVTSIPANMSGNHYGRWMRISNAGDVDIKANGGIRLALRDSSGNESYWYVGGSDTYPGGWAYFVVDLDRIPDANNGTNATVTSAADLGVGFKMLTKSGDDNAHMDLAHYGSSGLVVTGTPDTGTYGTDNAMQELYDIVASNNYGLLDKQAGVFVGKGPIQFNDNGTGTCTFEDAGSTLVWADLPVDSSFYKLSLGSSTGITTLRFGIVVGTGDNRQGVTGGSILTAGPAWGVDFSANLSANASNSIKLYGMSIADARVGLLFDDNSKTSAISTSFINCGEVDPGTTNNGAELLSCSIIDPTGLTNNYGLLFGQTPAAGALSHNCKKINFITSGSPTTQHMTRFTYAGDYNLTFTDMVTFGTYSGTIYHGLNSGSNADITINLAGTSNFDDTKFSNTAGGTVITVANAVTIDVTCLDQADGSAIEGTAVTVEANGAGPFPYNASVSITRSGSTATVSHTGHNLVTGNKAKMKGADQNEYNRIKTITKIDADSYSFQVSGTPATPATGTITATAVFIDTLTNASGYISDTRVFSSDQDITGFAAKGSSSPIYQRAPLTGTVSNSTGKSITSLMISDEN